MSRTAVFAHVETSLTGAVKNNRMEFGQHRQRVPISVYKEGIWLDVIGWLLDGDISVKYLTHRDLFGVDEARMTETRKRIGIEGYGARYLSCRNENGHWGKSFYQPKWTCTHYTLLDLMELGMPRDNMHCREAVVRAHRECSRPDGSINFARTDLPSDVCINGMVLRYSSYFGMCEKVLKGLIDYLLGVRLPDGGFGWNYLRDPENSDPHTTIAVLEGFLGYRKAGHSYRLCDIEKAETSAVRFLLKNNLFMTENTETFDKRYLKLSHPYRWRYDCLRALEYFSRAKNAA